MTEVERDILQTLQDIKRAVDSMSTAPVKPNLVPLFQRIESLRKTLPASTDPQLKHYLERQSYEKARLHLEAAQ